MDRSGLLQNIMDYCLRATRMWVAPIRELFHDAMSRNPAWVKTPCSRVADSPSTGKEISYLVRNPRFITIFTKARKWILSWAKINPVSHPISVTPYLILTSHLRRLRNGLFPSSFHTKFSPPRACYTPRLSHSHDFITQIMWWKGQIKNPNHYAISSILQFFPLYWY
jgi:hypothetical protein